MVDLTKIALALPDVGRGVACAGTALESQTFTANGKAFLFVSKKDVRLKLGASVADAKAMGCAVGANGWVKLALDELPAAAVLKRWIAESHGLVGAARPAASKKRAPRK